MFSPRLLAKVALLDPELTRSMPAPVTAAMSGFDALTHCIEAYLAKGDHPMADAIALSGIDITSKFLPRAVEDGTDLEARGMMMKAAMMGAVAFSKRAWAHATRTGAPIVVSEHGLHHGLANALCLPSVLQLQCGSSPRIACPTSRCCSVLPLEPLWLARPLSLSCARAPWVTERFGGLPLVFKARTWASWRTRPSLTRAIKGTRATARAPIC